MAEIYNSKTNLQDLSQISTILVQYLHGMGYHKRIRLVQRICAQQANEDDCGIFVIRNLVTLATCLTSGCKFEDEEARMLALEGNYRARFY